MIVLFQSSRLAAGWVRHHFRQHAARKIEPHSKSFGGHLFSSEAQRMRNFHTFSLQMARWSSGDPVLVRVNDDLMEGFVKEARGRGWFDVQLTESNTTMKCRANQLLDCVSTVPLAGTVETSFTAQNRTRPNIRADSGDAPNYVSPPPTIYDLDAALLEMEQVSDVRDRELLEQVKHHASYNKWVVFTDLHCSPASLDTCLKVLDEVHRLAVEKNAGVLFLGDFWHHRGTLRVDCLNAVLTHFRSWQVPMIMIPGNHDQVTLGGHNHGLTPIEHAYRVGSVPGPLVLSHPTKFRDALFIPHIRDIATMESILQSSTAHDCLSLFIHAEVTGALMNDLLVSTGGVPPASFPPNKHIYSGHFHKPHTVKSSNGVNIEYLGSPYEVSLAEANQKKMLAILDADADWKCLEYVPINVGRRHFKLSNWNDVLELKLDSENMQSIDNTDDIVRPGDRVVVSIPKKESTGIPSSVGSHIGLLRDSGVTVETREVKEELQERSELQDLTGLEEMSPESTWKAYLEEELRRESISSDNINVLLEAGLEILEEIETNSESIIEPNAVTDLRLKQVFVEGFGPFQAGLTYPLLNRGLVLLKGTNYDSGSDSNGSGKSSLAMAALWALTGSLDPRRAQDGKVSDVINDYSKVARVSLEGSINNLPFSITRTKMASKGGLVFLLDGKDLTTQSVKETQLMIEEKLGVSSQILSRTMFHGQHAINELLEATDAKFKDELSLVVPLDLWQSASSLARTKSRQAGKTAAELAGMIKIRFEDAEKLYARRDDAKQKSKEKHLALEQIKKEYELDMAAAVEEKATGVDLNILEDQLRKISSEIKNLDVRRLSLVTEKDSDLNPLQRSLAELNDSLGSITERCHFKEREVFAATLNVDAAKESIRQLEQKWSLNLSEGQPAELVLPEICPTCFQPVKHEASSEHSHVNLQGILEEEVSKGLDVLKAAESSLKLSEAELSDSVKSREAREEMRNGLVDDLDRATSLWDTQISKIEQDITLRRENFSHVSEQISGIARESQITAKQDSAKAKVESAISAADFADEVFTSLCKEIDDVEKRLNSLESELEEQTKTGRIMSDLGECFGPRGMQTFVLQNVVGALETISQVYLNDLSDGAQQLKLSLDAGDRISRKAFVVGADGTFKERPLSTLSGGQWRRCSLALTFAFAELVARRGKLRPSICVLDEPLTHLDASGRAKVGEVIRGMLRHQDSAEFRGFGGLGMSTVLIILQDLAAEELDEAFDCIDEVVKEKSESYIRIDELAG